MKILKYFSAVLLGLVMFAVGSHIGAEMRYEYVTAHTVGGEIRRGEKRKGHGVCQEYLQKGRHQGIYVQ